jgi:hypothetical protein
MRYYNQQRLVYGAAFLESSLNTMLYFHSLIFLLIFPWATILDSRRDIRLYCDSNDIIVTSRSIFSKLIIDFTK